MQSDTRRLEQQQFMLEVVTGEVVSYIAHDYGVGLIEAFGRFYQTALYKKMLDFDTFLYREGPGYLYELYKEEVVAIAS